MIAFSLPSLLCSRVLVAGLGHARDQQDTKYPKDCLRHQNATPRPLAGQLSVLQSQNNPEATPRRPLSPPTPSLSIVHYYSLAQTAGCSCISNQCVPASSSISCETCADGVSFTSALCLRLMHIVIAAALRPSRKRAQTPIPA